LMGVTVCKKCVAFSNTSVVGATSIFNCSCISGYFGHERFCWRCSEFPEIRNGTSGECRNFCPSGLGLASVNASGVVRSWGMGTHVCGGINASLRLMYKMWDKDRGVYQHIVVGRENEYRLMTGVNQSCNGSIVGGLYSLWGNTSGPDGRQLECRRCPNGTYQKMADNGMHICEECPVDSVSPAGSSSISQCNKCSYRGNYNVGGSSRCLCARDTYWMDGPSVCVCGPGDFFSMVNYTCLHCPPMWYKNGTSAEPCTLCPPGMFCRFPRSTECEYCAVSNSLVPAP
jgi:hypothetical protein